MESIQVPTSYPSIDIACETSMNSRIKTPSIRSMEWKAFKILGWSTTGCSLKGLQVLNHLKCYISSFQDRFGWTYTDSPFPWVKSGLWRRSIPCLSTSLHTWHFWITEWNTPRPRSDSCLFTPLNLGMSSPTSFFPARQALLWPSLDSALRWCVAPVPGDTMRHIRRHIDFFHMEVCTINRPCLCTKFSGGFTPPPTSPIFYFY